MAAVSIGGLRLVWYTEAIVILVMITIMIYDNDNDNDDKY